MFFPVFWLIQATQSMQFGALKSQNVVASIPAEMYPLNSLRGHFYFSLLYQWSLPWTTKSPNVILSQQIELI